MTLEYPEALLRSQNTVIARVFGNVDVLRITNPILCGGTALSRFYLKHRVSYDLDFMVEGSFEPEILTIALGRLGIHMHDWWVGKPGTATQLHGLGRVDNEDIKLSFVEDAYITMFETVICEGAVTEVLDGLYHRKLRTVSGAATEGTELKGNRQKARDLFDLFALSRQHEDTVKFIQRINRAGANVAEGAFIAGLSGMPWADLEPEFKEMLLADKYLDISWLGDVKGWAETTCRRLEIEHAQSAAKDATHKPG